jgi:hypothetical protein
MQASQNGLSRKQINSLFHRHLESGRSEEAVAQLASLNAINCRRVRTAGRPSTLWSLTKDQPTSAQDLPIEAVEAT